MKYLTDYVPQGGGMSDGYVAVEENGELKLQKLSFNGTEAIPDGATEAMLEVGLFPTGMDEPAYAGSGGGGGGSSMKFYKCASVDTTMKTWTGYELILTDGKYTVSSDITTGLTYTTMTPTVNYIYSEDALIRVGLYYDGIPTDGLVFYASLNGETPDTAETGQVLSQVSADASQPVQYTTVDGVSCASFGSVNYGDDCGYGGLSFDASDLPRGSSVRTISFWVKFAPVQSAVYFFFYGSYASNMVGFLSSPNYGTINFVYNYDDNYVNGFSFSDRFHHVAVVVRGSTNNDIDYYFDGVKQNENLTQGGAGNSIDTSGGTCYLGCGRSGSLGRFDGWVSSVRIYDRILSQEEITVLASEFTPTTA